MRAEWLLVLGLLAQPALAAESAWRALPDWSGDWVLAAPVKQEMPPYSRAWLAAHPRDAAKDPAAGCGVPVGMPRMMALSHIHEWIVRPEGVWHAVENGNFVRRIYTDGRAHPDERDLFATYTGDNTGHWEGDTLVVDTIGLRDDTWLGEGGLTHSDALHVVSRVRKLPSGLLEARLTLTDPKAFTRPWEVVRRYRRLPDGAHVHDFACRLILSPADDTGP